MEQAARGGPRQAGPAEPGSGWPGDPADARTPVARDPAEVDRVARAVTTTPGLDAAVSVCRACPRLVAWREQVARTGRRAYAGQRYWGRPVPGWGEPRPPILLVGLAPAAHGGNRTGRVFTGDRSGDHLATALHRAGLAARGESEFAGDGQRLAGPRGAVRMTAAVHCAPPGNSPTRQESATCAPWLDRELRLLAPDLAVIVALGGVAWAAVLTAVARLGVPRPRPLPRFTHGGSWQLPVSLPGAVVPAVLLGCYHPSQQNTFTGRLTPAMTDAVLARALELAGPPASSMPRSPAG